MITFSLFLIGLGTEITCQHFLPGQFINVQGYRYALFSSLLVPSIGKGFQGGMKRHGFAGLGASHGVSVSHRSIGSTGGRQVSSSLSLFTSPRTPDEYGKVRKCLVIWAMKKWPFKIFKFTKWNLNATFSICVVQFLENPVLMSRFLIATN